MIYGEIRELKFYKGISKNLDTAIENILKGEYKNCVVGKNIIDGEEVFFNCEEKTTKNDETALFEGHKKYIDIHLIIKGEENIGYSQRSNVVRLGAYDRIKDFEVYEGSVDHFFYVNDDVFIIFFPEEPHMPLIKVDEPQDIKKVVFKVKV